MQLVALSHLVANALQQRIRRAGLCASAAAEASAPRDWIDPFARNANRPAEAPADDTYRRATPDGRVLILVPICTRGDCVTLSPAGDFDGFFCPCCGAHYDTAGRIRKGPAPQNLAIPPFRLDEKRRTLMFEAHRWRGFHPREIWS